MTACWGPKSMVKPTVCTPGAANPNKPGGCCPSTCSRYQRAFQMGRSTDGSQGNTGHGVGLSASKESRERKNFLEAGVSH